MNEKTKAIMESALTFWEHFCIETRDFTNDEINDAYKELSRR